MLKKEIKEWFVSYSDRVKLMPDFQFLTQWFSTSGSPQHPSWMRHQITNLLPLAIVVLGVFFLKLHLALADPVLHAVDPWLWALKIESYSRDLTIEHLAQPLQVYPGWGYVVYPRAYPLLATLVALATGTSGYEVVRFYPVISALNLIPMYFLSLLISKSRRIAIASIVLVSVSKWYSIRTSIGNPECFTYFWLVFSLIFLLMLRDSPARRNIISSIFFMTVTVLFWHFTIAVYCVFLPLLVVANFRNRSYCQRLTLVTVSSAFTAGVLWYFWVDPIGWVTSLATEIGPSPLPTAQSISPVLESSLAESWGYVLLILGILGFVYVLARRSSRQDPSKIFLVAYFSSILVLIIVSLRVGWAGGVYRLFSSLAFPVSLFAAIALVTIIDATQKVTPTHEGTLSKLESIRTRQTQTRMLTVFVMIMVLLASSSPINYGGRTDYSVSLRGFVVGDRESAIDGQGSRWIVTFQYGKAFDAPSDNLYVALKWIGEHSTEQSCVGAFLTRPSPSALPGSVLRGAFLSISERSLVEATEFGSSLNDSATAFRDRMSKACDGDVYVVTGIRSWLGEEWADPHLELQFLSYAAQAPDLFPRVHSVGEVRVFYMTHSAASAVFATSKEVAWCRISLF